MIDKEEVELPIKERIKALIIAISIATVIVAIVYGGRWECVDCYHMIDRMMWSAS